jgi:uncharacterized iron-regulated membrane protein
LKRWKRESVKALAWFHRWLGIATCAIFAMWFFSGAILLFQPFPSLARAEQIALTPAVSAAGVAVPAAAAAAYAGDELKRIRIIERIAAPAWIVDTSAGPAAVDARTGQPLAPLTAEEVRSVVAQAVAIEPDAVAGPIYYDQWIVHNRFDPYRPFFRVRVGDAQKTELYVSATTGEILQKTTSSERIWNWAGAVLHWVYFTPLRSSFTAWDQTVWWLSLVATLVAVAGTTLGVLRTLAVRRAGRPGLTYFQPVWLKYHHLLGLFAAIFVLIWITSGWLSMDHGRIFSRGTASVDELSRFEGIPLASAAGQIDLSALRALPRAKEISVAAVGGEALIVVSGADDGHALFDASGRPIDTSSRTALFRRGLAAAWPGARISGGDHVSSADLYAAAEGMPPSAVRFEVEGREKFDVYINADDGRILTVMDRSRASYAWVYYALHTFKFPGLIERPMVRKALVLAPLTLGFLFSLTGVVIGVQRLRRSM